MAKYARREDLITTTLSFKMFNKRYCDLTIEERREYFKERKRASRQKEFNWERTNESKTN